VGSAVGWHINYPDQRRSQTLAQHQTENVGSLRAEGHADANLTGTQAYVIGHDSVQAHRGQQQSQRGQSS